ncbi:hypothetical protein WOSG25_090900 [Weissella oryzae SG25]|uniref:Uncharacterized protein n=1 Tax=Weissella oryzae (strain DSM 25784 / JCM 18191 / LMG 30913 / SG25) TaxID=1329250 RepID=A0A069CVI2_WEIOS|nr:DUF975 family protein [Weissella oryzae]GAK31392.1 hypothetical protein WOSG25_090900 [Weissella oryzae SG25]
MAWKEIQENIEQNRLRRVEIKAQAQKIFKRDWLGNLSLWLMPFVTMALGLFLLGALIGGFVRVKSTMALIGVLLLFFLGLFLIGLIVSYGLQVIQYRALAQWRDSTTKAAPFTSYFQQFLQIDWLKRSILVAFVTGIFIILWGLLPYLLNYAAGVLTGLAFMTGSMGADSSGLIGWAWIVRLGSWALFALLIYKILGYTFGPYFMLDAKLRDRSLGGRTMLKQGLALVKGHRFELLTAVASFFWWFMLVILVEFLLFRFVNDIVAVLAFALLWSYIGSYITLTWTGYYETLKATSK